MPFPLRLKTASLFLILTLMAVPTRGADWPTWHFDAHRSAASPQELPAQLHLQWARVLPRLKPAWPDQPRMQSDAVYQPVVLGKRLFVGSSVHDGVTAYDTGSGKELWRIDTDGPVRYAPAAWEDAVYFVADDGCLYCVEAATGTLRWKMRGGPSDRKVLGNERLISTWPARGAPVIADGTVYFAAGVWPFMGIFLQAVDARTGKVVWTNDGDGSLYIKQPHNADSFAGVAPQGYLVVTGNRLLVPGGRSVPACYDRNTGKFLYYQLAENGKRGGGSEVAALGKLFCNGGMTFDLATEKFLGFVGDPVVLTDEVLYAAQEKKCVALGLKEAGVQTVETVDRKGEKVKQEKWTAPELGSVALAKATALIKAGSRLYAASGKQVVAIELHDGKPGAIAWRLGIDGTPANLLAADDRLFVVTREGRILCYGAERVAAKVHESPVAPEPPAGVWPQRAKEILDLTQARDGYCVAWGIGSGRLITELAGQSNLRIVAVDPDANKVRELRAHLRAAGISGERVSVFAGDPLAFPLPPYLASLMVSEDLAAAGLEFGSAFVRKAFAALQPFGGVACLPVAAEKERDCARWVEEGGLANSKVVRSGELLLLSREGALPGSANWTHEHADAANTRVSRDRLVKAPLGVHWFGGPAHDAILPRHGHGPQPQVIDGRLLIEGIDLLRCLDIYTGRLLWEAKLPGVGLFYNNLAHQPGANSSGTNFISTPDGIYVAYGSVCLRLDPATGGKLAEFKLPSLPDVTAKTRWGYVNVVGDYLVGGADPLFDVGMFKSLTVSDEKKSTDDTDKKPDDKNSTAKALDKVARAQNDNWSSSKHLFVLNRHTGQVLWTATARDGFRHNAICAGGGRLYAIDRLSGPQVARLKRRGEEPKVPSRLTAFDLATGKPLWQTEDNVFGTWLSYAAAREVLVEAGRVARDTISDEPKGMRVYRGANGAVLWFEKDHAGPAMIHGDTILMAGSACELLTGAKKMRPDPLTGKLVEWTWSRNYGCNTPAASEHLLTFRSGAAGYYDLCHDGGTGNFGGFRSSCTNNLVVAGGLLTAPEYTRTCVCNYQNQTSLALIHMPEAEMWTFFGSSEAKEPVRRAGINFGAPGDRRAENGTLWVEYPSVAGKSPVVPIRLGADKPDWFRRHASQIEGELPWVASSGVRGLSTVAFSLATRAESERAYTVRLVFAEPDEIKPGERAFDVSLQGKKVLTNFDMVKEAGGCRRSLVKEFKGVKVKDELVVKLTARKGTPVLCGVEVVAEGW